MSIMCMGHILKQISNIKVELIRNMKQMNIVFNVVINTEE
ncbi:Nematode cuticle collagen N-terminal domain [Moritella viscosa]|nr:Nematode cuticle collagen N-terminal domain [Moritella viscosa]